MGQSLSFAPHGIVPLVLYSNQKGIVKRKINCKFLNILTKTVSIVDDKKAWLSGLAGLFGTLGVPRKFQNEKNIESTALRTSHVVENTQQSDLSRCFLSTI